MRKPTILLLLIVVYNTRILVDNINSLYLLPTIYNYICDDLFDPAASRPSSAPRPLSFRRRSTRTAAASPASSRAPGLPTITADGRTNPPAIPPVFISPDFRSLCGSTKRRGPRTPDLPPPRGRPPPTPGPRHHCPPPLLLFLLLPNGRAGEEGESLGDRPGRSGGVCSASKHCSVVTMGSSASYTTRERAATVRRAIISH